MHQRHGTWHAAFMCQCEFTHAPSYAHTYVYTVTTIPPNPPYCSYMGYSFGATWMNSSTSVLAPFTNVSCAGTVWVEGGAPLLVQPSLSSSSCFSFACTSCKWLATGCHGTTCCSTYTDYNYTSGQYYQATANWTWDTCTNVDLEACAGGDQVGRQVACVCENKKECAGGAWVCGGMNGL